MPVCIPTWSNCHVSAHRDRPSHLPGVGGYIYIYICTHLHMYMHVCINIYIIYYLYLYNYYIYIFIDVDVYKYTYKQGNNPLDPPGPCFLRKYRACQLFFSWSIVQRSILKGALSSGFSGRPIVFDFRSRWILQIFEMWSGQDLPIQKSRNAAVSHEFRLALSRYMFWTQPGNMAMHEPSFKVENLKGTSTKEKRSPQVKIMKLCCDSSMGKGLHRHFCNICINICSSNCRKYSDQYQKHC